MPFSGLLERRDKNGDLVYTDDRSVWPAVEELRTQIEEAQSIRDGETELTAGIVSKVRNGIKKVLYPVTHAKAVWYSMKDNQTVYDVVSGLLEKVKELGPGDMLKSTYDPNGDGVVDNASKLGGQSPAYYQKASDDTLNTQNKTVVGAVNEVQEMAKSGGRDLIGKEFLDTKDYTVGRHAIKDNKRYRFTTEHPAGEWDESHVVEATVDEEMEDLTEKMDVDKIIIGTFAIDFNGGIGYLPYNHYSEYEKEPICIAMIVGTQRYGMTVVPSNYKDGRIELYTDAAINGNLYVSYFIGLRK